MRDEECSSVNTLPIGSEELRHHIRCGRSWKGIVAVRGVPMPRVDAISKEPCFASRRSTMLTRPMARRLLCRSIPWTRIGDTIQRILIERQVAGETYAMKSKASGVSRPSADAPMSVNVNNSSQHARFPGYRSVFQGPGLAANPLDEEAVPLPTSQIGAVHTLSIPVLPICWMRRRKYSSCRLRLNCVNTTRPSPA